MDHALLAHTPWRWWAWLSIISISVARLQPWASVWAMYQRRSSTGLTFSSSSAWWPQGSCHSRL